MPLSAEANNHAYQIVLSDAITWDNAHDGAKLLNTSGLPWNLATRTSDEEHDFIVSLLSDPTSHIQYWVGGVQEPPTGKTDPADDWTWLNGETLEARSYTNWANDPDQQPDDYSVFQPFLALDGRGNVPWKWEDNDGYTYLIIGYIAESTNPIPEPTTMLLFGSGLLSLAGFRRRFKKS